VGKRARFEFDDQSFARSPESSHCRVVTAIGSHLGLLLLLGLWLTVPGVPLQASEMPGNEPAIPIALTNSTTDPPQEVVVTAERGDLIGTASTASEGIVVGDRLSIAPAYRPGQLLETVPGLVVTSHSGKGKANQAKQAIRAAAWSMAIAIVSGVIAIKYVNAPVPLVWLPAGSFVGTCLSVVTENAKAIRAIPGCSRNRLTVPARKSGQSGCASGVTGSAGRQEQTVSFARAIPVVGSLRAWPNASTQRSDASQ